jgi:hypothetical protein
MGGSTELYWRGVRICACMKAPLDELAKLTGADFKVTPISGFGSYQDGSTASGSTATGGGHIDIHLGGYSSTIKKRVEALARKIGFYADIREPKWCDAVLDDREQQLVCAAGRRTTKLRHRASRCA